nr:hypothetical protein CFP56_36118 [Quercus suber]
MHRKILEEPICERCKLAVEDSKHALWSCPKLDVVWADQEKWGFRCEIEFTCVRELLSWMIKEGTSLELLTYMAWTVWNQRKKVRLNLQACSMHHVVEQAAELLAQYKASTEASVFNDANKSGVGVVIRDSYGAVLASCLEKILQAYKTEVTEVLSAWKALLFAHELGFQNVILKGDALHLIQALKSQEQSLCLLGLLVEDVKIYSSHFQRMLYSHVKRNSNGVAHNLARHAISKPDFQKAQKKKVAEAENVVVPQVLLVDDLLPTVVQEQSEVTAHFQGAFNEVSVVSEGEAMIHDGAELPKKEIRMGIKVESTTRGAEVLYTAMKSTKAKAKEGVEMVTTQICEKEGVLKDIWRLKVPNKVKVFLWRACSRALPTKVNLQKRRVVDNSTCDQCGCMAEDEFHALWDCEKVHEVWAPAFGEVRRKGQSLLVMSDLVSFTKVEGLILELFAMTAWLIWMQRNKLRANDNPQPCSRVAYSASALLAKFQQGKQGSVRGNRTSLSGLVSNATVGHLVKDIMSIRGHFQSSNIIHVRRQGNNVAHALARDVSFSFPLRVWMEEVPPNISCFVVRDLS